MFAVTYKDEMRRGQPISGVFIPVDSSAVTNWGNPVQRWFMDRVEHWRSSFVNSLANDFFRVALRRAASNVNLWSWALEWNRNYRLIGFFGDDMLVENELKSMPPRPTSIPAGTTPDGAILRFTPDVMLPDEVDVLFVRDIPNDL